MRKLIIIGFIILLGGSSSYVLLDTFAIKKSYATVTSSTASSVSAKATSTSMSSTIKTYRQNDTTIYVADVQLAAGQTIQAALADNTYGKNITDTTSHIASTVQATVAINGDFYGARSNGYVIRNNELLRSTKNSDDQEDVVLWEDGTMTIVKEGDVTAQQLVDKGAVQVLSFGPGLIINSAISVAAGDEVGQAMASNPRTALGYLGQDHYILVVADGRTTESSGLTLLQLATFMASLGASQAYNLDGGGSSTMYSTGKVINKPTTNGSTISERNVSDILYVK